MTPELRIEKMKLVTLAGAAALALFSTAAAHACDEDTIESVSNDVLVMQSGHVYRAHSSSDIVGWMGVEDVLICNSQMINKDENGEQADVSKLD